MASDCPARTIQNPKSRGSVGDNTTTLVTKAPMMARGLRVHGIKRYRGASVQLLGSSCYTHPRTSLCWDPPVDTHTGRTQPGLCGWHLSADTRDMGGSAWQPAQCQAEWG